MTNQPFVFSDETGRLSDEEYTRALAWLSDIRGVIDDRARRAESDPDWARLACPDGGWHPNYPASIEMDGSIQNIQTSYSLLAGGDRDVIRKLRLYCQVFTGYQLATLERAGIRPWIAAKLPDDWDKSLRYLAGPPTVAINNLYEVSRALPAELRIDPPRKFGEIGWGIDGSLMNHDVYGYQQIVCLMYENGLIDLLTARLARQGYLKIVEVGGGYGALAHHLMGMFNEKVHYAIVDIPESLAFSSIYCSTLRPEMPSRLIIEDAPFSLNNSPGLTFIPNMYHRNIETGSLPVDLCINTLSLAEMTQEQVEDYCDSISRLLGETGLFFEQNHQRGKIPLNDIFPRYFKNLRKCETGIIPTYPTIRGEANFWVNSLWRDE